MNGRATLTAVVASGLVLRALLAFTAVNEIWPDEIFQTLEQAHRAAFGYGVVPWEFREAARSWLFPGALALVMKVGAIFDEETGHRVATSLALVWGSVAPIWLSSLKIREKDGAAVAVVCGVVLGLWFELVYFAPKALNEVVAAHSALCALLLEARERPRTFGALLGMAAAIRIHLLLALILCLVWSLRSLGRGEKIRVLVAFALPLILAGMLDALTWQYPFQSFVRTIELNLIEGRSAAYGVAPFWAYASAELAVLGALGAAFFWVLAALGARRAPLVALFSLAVVLTHASIGHKEYRFVYPALFGIAILAAFGIAEVARTRGKSAGVLASVLVVLLSGWRSTTYSVETTTLGGRLYRPGSLWSNDRGPLLAFAHLARSERLCGVGLVRVPWYQTGGYSWLHRDVPILDLRRFEAEAAVGPRSVDAIVAVDDLDARYSEFERIECWDGTCLYQRAGSCAESPHDWLNRTLAATGN